MLRSLLLHAGALLAALALFVVGAVAAVPVEIGFIRAMGITEIVLSDGHLPAAVVVRGGTSLAIPVLGAHATAIADTWARRQTPPVVRWALFVVAPAVSALAGLVLRATWLYVGVSRTILDERMFWSLDSFALTRWMVGLGLMAAMVQVAVVAWRGRAARSTRARTG